MKKCETVKLYFNKYPYKLIVKNGLASQFRDRSLLTIRNKLAELDAIKDQLAGNNPTLVWYSHYNRQATCTTTELADAHRVLKELDKTTTDYKLRIQANTISVFSCDADWLKKLGNKTTTYGTEFYAPHKNKIDDILSGSIAAPSYLTGFDFRVTLRHAKQDSKKLGTWIENCPDKVKTNRRLIKALKDNDWIDGRIFYVDNEKTLLLVKLLAGRLIRRVDTLVYG